MGSLYVVCKMFIQENMEDLGCFYVNLSNETVSEKMLKSTKRANTGQQVWRSLEALRHSKITLGASLMLGSPGETLETIAVTLSVLNEYSILYGEDS